MIRRLCPIAITALILLAAPAARAEVFQLLDNTQVNGKILHYYDGVFSVETAGGQKIELPHDKLKSITFKLPPPRAEFSAPDKTFLRWHDSLSKGDSSRFVDCYALMYQGMLQSQLGASGDEFKKMQKEVEGTKLEVKSTKITGETALLKVVRSKGDDVMTAEFRLVLENGEWKMTP